jgi:hypothetical protein
MAETDLAVTVEPDWHLYFFHVPVPVQDEGQAGTEPDPDLYGMQASETIPVPSR